MKILPKNEHLEVAMIINTLIGVWPFIINTKMRRYYKIYSKLIFIYFLQFLIKSYIKLYFILSDEIIDTKELFENLATTLLCSITVMRVYAMKTQTMMNIIRTILETENRIITFGEVGEIDIYRSFAYQSKASINTFLLCLFIVTTLYFSRPLFIEGKLEMKRYTNETVLIRPFPLSTWFPYNEQDNYLLSYIWQLIDGVTAASFVTYTDCIIFSLIIFPLGQITLLNYTLRNLNIYIEKIIERTRKSSEEASRFVLRNCAVHHQMIIRYINDFNQTFGYIMLLDFLQSSLQLASILIQLATMTNMNPFSILNSAQFVVSMLVRLLVYYWYANEIIYESAYTLRSIYMSNWEGESRSVKMMMLIMMMRSSVPLSLRMASFGTMSLETFVKILKGSYTYLMFVTRMKK